MLSAGLLLFGIMTIWLPPVRQALVHYPLATISLLLCLALIFKFGQQGGIVGLMTGGVLTLYVIAVILAQTPQIVPVDQSQLPDVLLPVPPMPQRTQEPTIQRPHSEAPPSTPPTPELRELTASKGAVLKFVFGVVYRLRIRGGLTTSIIAIRGSFALYNGDQQVGICTNRLDLSAPAGATPYVSESSSYRTCGRDALLRVIDIR